MSLDVRDVEQVAMLAQLHLSEAERDETLAQMRSIFGLIDEMGAVDTAGVEPLMHPISMILPLAQRLREDAVRVGNQRDVNMRNAPAAQEGLFLVPKVIE